MCVQAQTNNEYTGRRKALARAMGSRYLLHLIRGGAVTHLWKNPGAATIRAPLSSHDVFRIFLLFA
jgi:hypothetical protein